MPTWVYGEIKCTTTHIATWVYGATLCTTIPSIAYPTLAWVRVTSLIHRFRPGLYTLTMGLGDLTTDFVMPSMIARPISAPPPKPPEPPKPPTPGGECPEDGMYRCIGHNLYQCQFHKWVLKEINSTMCGAPPPPEKCPEGMYTCKGKDLYQCQFGKWVLKETNSPTCGYK